MSHQIYEPNKYLKAGIRIWPEMIAELIASKELIWRIFVRDFSAKYKQFLFGSLWVILKPFVAIGTFVILNRVGIVNIGETDVPYPLFALIGLTVWQIFAGGINCGCNSLVSAGDMISKINFPREVLVFASIALAMVDFLIKFCLILICFPIFKFMPSWGILLFPFSLIPIFVLSVGLSLILSLVNGVFRDTSGATVIGTTFLMLLTPVLYPVTPDKVFFFKLNPLTPLITGPRDLIIYGAMSEPLDFFISTVLSILVFLVAWRTFHLVETKIPERI